MVREYPVVGEKKLYGNALLHFRLAVLGLDRGGRTGRWYRRSRNAGAPAESFSLAFDACQTRQAQVTTFSATRTWSPLRFHWCFDGQHEDGCPSRRTIPVSVQ